MKTVSAVLLLFSLVAFSLVSTELFAQQGGIRGKVIDDDGNPLEGVEVVIQAQRGANRAIVRTGAKGQFLRLGLQPGTYQIDFALEGYEPAYAEVTISSGQAYRIDGIPLAKKPEGVLGPEAHAQARAALDIAATATAAGGLSGRSRRPVEIQRARPRGVAGSALQYRAELREAR